MRGINSYLIQGAIDMHTHGYPEVRVDYQLALDDVEMAEYAQQQGMGGYVLKSHLWPTMGRVYHIRKMVHELKVFSSITLNSLVGGIHPAVVETAAAQGAQVVWFPTWSSAHDLKRGGFSKDMLKLLPGLKAFATGLSVLTGSRALTQEAKDILQIAKEAKLVLCTGHLSPAEALALCDEAQRIGFDKLVFTHPDSGSVGATKEEILEAAKRGAYIEWTALGQMPMFQRVHPRHVAEMIQEIGPERCLLTTDTFFPWAPPEPDLMMLYLATLRDLGVSFSDIQTMVVDNPRKLLGLN